MLLSGAGRLDAARETSRAATMWAITQALPGLMIKHTAKNGDLAASITADPRIRMNPFATYEQLRARGPLVRGSLVWATVDHAVCSEILRSPAFGVATTATVLPRPLEWVVTKCTNEYSLGPIDPPSLLAVDPPLHTRYRKLVSRNFTTRAVAAHTERIEAVADELLAALPSSEPFDLVERYAALLPVTVIADILGVPQSMRDQFLAWGNAAALTLDPGLSWSQYRAAEQALHELHAWFDAHLQRLRTEPGADVLSNLVTLEGTEELSPLELRAIAMLLLGAGFETTVNLIGNVVGQLFAHPDQRELVRAEPTRWPDAVEETLRFDSPVQLAARMAGEQVDVAGRALAPGTVVLTLLGGANRDPKVFSDPQRFDITRANVGAHLTFSAGAHYCLGAGLARLEATIAVRKLFEHFPQLRAAGVPTRRTMRVLRGYEHLPVTG